jgi:hypothetical protein
MSDRFLDMEHAKLSRILQDVAKHRELPNELKLTTFSSMRGERYVGELMVVGRAVNGWRVHCTPAELADPTALTRVVDETLQSSGRCDDECPMLWVTKHWGSQKEYNTNKSAFWRVIREVTGALRIADIEKPSWPSYLMWSNLYRVAPASGGNPFAHLIDAQVDGCGELLDAEINEWKPKRVLFLTGGNWAERLRPLKRARRLVAEPSNKYVDAVMELDLVAPCNTVRVVIAKHPQGKREAEMVGEIVAAFSR